MKVKSYIYGYLKGSLSEAQLQGTFSDIARKMWWLLYVSNNHRACLREARVLPKSLGAIAFPARFSFKSARRRIKETRTTSCDWGLNFENHCLWSKSQGFWLDGGWQISPYRKYVFFFRSLCNSDTYCSWSMILSQPSKHVGLLFYYFIIQY